MLPHLSRELLSRWNDIFPQTPRPDSLTYLGIAGSVEGGTTTYLGFGSRQKKPYFAAKIHRDPDAEPRIIREREVLKTLQSAVPSVASAVPQVFFSGCIEKTWVIVESILDGVPMVLRLSDTGIPRLDQAERDMRDVSEWLRCLSESTGQKETRAREELVRCGNRTIHDFTSLFPLSRKEELFLEELRNALDEISGEGGPIQHGDFCRQNILTSKVSGKERLSFIDWTDSQPLGFPFHDLFFFLTSYYLQSRKQSGMESFLEAFEETFFRNSSYGNLIREIVQDQCLNLKLERGKARLLYALFLMNQSLFEHEKMSRYGLRGGLPRFVLYLASTHRKRFKEALKEQIWIYFFRAFVEKRKDFIL